MRLQGKRAFVTAAGQGIGRATVELFVREGAEVIATDINAASLESLTGCRTMVRHRHPVQLCGLRTRGLHSGM
jgi:2-keto-3-deoxy-L-fuconate dehydrogenase